MNYAPPPPPVAEQSYGPSPVAGRSGSKLKWVIISVVLGIFLLVALFVVAIFWAIFGAMKSSEPYQHAVWAATHDPRVQARLGAPVKPGWLFGGSINVAGDSGQADLTIPVEGANGKGTVYVVARKSEGQWTYQTLAVRLEGSAERLDLLRSPGPTPRER